MNYLLKFHAVDNKLFAFILIITVWGHFSHLSRIDCITTTHHPSNMWLGEYPICRKSICLQE